MGGWVDECVGRWVDGWVAGWVGGWINGRNEMMDENNEWEEWVDE